MVTTLKHNMSAMMTGDAGFWGIMNGVNTASNNILAYSMVFTLFIVSATLLIRKTQDVGKSLVMSSYITTISTMILYFGGLEYGTKFVPDIVMLSLVIGTITGTVFLKIMRYNRNENL